MSSAPSYEELQQQLQASIAAQQRQAEQFQEMMSHAEARSRELEQQLRQQMHLSQLQQQQQQQQASMLASAHAGASSSPQSLSSGANAQPHVSLRVDLKPLQPSAFHGNSSSNVEQWCQELERYFHICGIGEHDSRRAALASTYLRDAASTWYISAMKNHELTADSPWSEFRAQIVARFRRFAAARVARAALKKLRHHAKVQGYTAEFMKLMQDIPDMSVADQLDHYLDGLQRHIALEVDREQPATLAQAMEAAQRVELLLSTRGQGQAYGPGAPQARRFFAGPPQSRQQTGGGGAPMELSAVREQGQETESDRDLQEAEQQAFVMRQQNRSRGNGASSFSRSQSGPRQPMRFPGLTEQEVERRYREGRCFTCNETGHSARECNKRPGNGSARQ